MAEHVVCRIEPCEWGRASECGFPHDQRCRFCRTDGTRLVEQTPVELAPGWWWSPREQAATAGVWGHGDDQPVWIEQGP